MDKVAMYKEEIVNKVAASFNARRNKQYWQLLKKIYGGVDNAVNSIKKTKDVGIYHGTNKPSLSKILNEGFDVGKNRRTMYGKGAYMGEKEVADRFGDVMVQLKKPSELKGTKALYPKTQKAFASNLGINPKIADKNLVKAQAYGRIRNVEEGKAFMKLYNKNPISPKSTDFKGLPEYNHMTYRANIPSNLLKEVKK